MAGKPDERESWQTFNTIPIVFFIILRPQLRVVVAEAALVIHLHFYLS